MSLPHRAEQPRWAPLTDGKGRGRGGRGCFFSVKLPSPPGLCHSRGAGESVSHGIQAEREVPESPTHGVTACPLPCALNGHKPGWGGNSAGLSSSALSRLPKAKEQLLSCSRRREGSGRCLLWDPHSHPCPLSSLWQPQSSQPGTGLVTVLATRKPRCLSVLLCAGTPRQLGSDPGSSRQQESVWPPLLAARLAGSSSFSSRLWDNRGKRGAKNPPSIWLQPSQLIPPSFPVFPVSLGVWGGLSLRVLPPCRGVRARGKDVVTNELLLPPQRIPQKTIHTLHQLPPPAPS